MGKPYLYRCPNTGMNVQGYLDDREAKPSATPRFEAVTCLACGLFHFVNSQTGRLLSDDGRDPLRPA